MRKLPILAALALLFSLTGFGQGTPQWFVKDVEIVSGYPIPFTPDYRASGTFVNDRDNSVFVYGTVGYNHDEVAPGNGGFGGSDIFITRKDQDGNVIWKYILGTEHDDVIVRLVATDEGWITICGYTDDGEQRQIFLNRYAWGSGSGQSLSPQWQNYFEGGTPTDLIETHREDEVANGWAMCGQRNGKGFVVSVNGGGTPKYNQQYDVAYNGTNNFTSLTENQVGNGSTDPKSLVLAGTSLSGGVGAMRIENTSGTVLFANAYDLPYCRNSQPKFKSKVYNRVISDKNNDLVFFGNGASLLKMNEDLDQAQWVTSLNNALTYVALDVRETFEGYLTLGRTQSEESNIHLIRTDYQGNILGHKTVGTSTIDYDVDDSSPTEFSGPTITLSVEDDFYYHYSFTETGATGTSRPQWYINRAIHVKSNLVQFTCDEVTREPSPFDCGTDAVELYNEYPDHNGWYAVQISAGPVAASNPIVLQVGDPEGDEATYCPEEPILCQVVNTYEDATICSDGSPGIIGLTGVSGTAYWSTGATTPTIFISQTGEYTLWYYPPGEDCPEVYHYNVTVAPEPSVFITEPCCSTGTGGDIGVCNNGGLGSTLTVTITDLGGNLLGSGTISGQLCVSLSSFTGGPFQAFTSYIVTITDENGCSWYPRASFECNPNCRVDVSEDQGEEAGQNITLFPNPTADLFVLRSETELTGTVKVTDLTGRILEQRQVTNVNQVELSLEEQAEGIYMVILETANNVSSYRIVKSQ